MPTRFANQIDNCPIYAKRAEEDQNGVNIDQYYAKKTDLPTVNDGTLTIQKNGTTVNTFSANSSSDKTVNIEVPTKTSDLQNDSNFITASDAPVQDVKVNGSSVVDEHGVANVDTSGLATKQEVTNGLATKQDTINDLSDIRAGAEKGATSVQDVEVDGTSVVNANGVAEIDLSDYAHQSDIPDVPVQDVEVNGASVVNASGVAEITVPTKTSDLQNDSNFITASDVPAQQQADWQQSNSSAVDYIRNKPQIPSKTSDLQNDSNFITASDVPGAQEQSDWSESDSSDPAYIKNKPSIPSKTSDLQNDSGFITASDVPGSQEQSDWSEADSSDPAYIKNKPDLSIYAEKSDLATVATTGDYDDLQHKPTIPAAQVQSDYGQTDSSAVDFIKNKPDLSIYAEKSELAAVATSGDYDDLQHKPSIPAAQVQSDWAQSDSSAVDYIKNKPQNLVQDASYVHTDNNFTNNDKNKLDGIAAGAEVNVQSDWNQSDSSADDYIKNKPSIPVVPTLVEGANITITQNGNTITIANKMTAGDGIDIDANGVISVDADYLNIDYWHGGSSVALASGSNLNANLSATSYRGSNIYASSGAITLKKGTYGVHAFVKISNAGVTPNANLYKISVNGGITGGTPVKTIEFDNSFAHEEVYELSFMTFNASDTDAALVLTCDALTQLAGIACALSYIQVYCLNGLVGQSGGSGGTANVAITSSDHSVTVNETTIGDTSSFDLSVPQQVQSNWNESNQNSKAFIQNKPTIPSKTSDLQNDSGFITASQVPAQVQSDWNQSDSSAVDYIKNKPTIPAAQVQSDWSQPNSGSVDYIKNKPLSLTLVQGNGMTLTEDSTNNTLTIINAAPVPTVGSGDNGKVLKASYSGGTASYSWETESGGGGAQVQSNWTEADTTSPAYIQNKPATKSLAEGAGIHISETSNSVTISADAAPAWDVSSEVTLTASGTNYNTHRFVITDTVPKIYKATAFVNSSNGYIRIREDYNGANHDWMIIVTLPSISYSLYFSVYDSSNSLNTKYRMLCQNDTVSSPEKVVYYPNNESTRTYLGSTRRANWIILKTGPVISCYPADSI